MSIATQITRLSGLRDSIRTKLIGLGLLPSGSTADLEDCKDAIVGIELQSKTVSPSTSSQTVTPDSGKLGLSQVTVNAAPRQLKTVNLSTSNQTITADAGYYGLAQVTVKGWTTGIYTTKSQLLSRSAFDWGVVYIAPPTISGATVVGYKGIWLEENDIADHSKMWGIHIAPIERTATWGFYYANTVNSPPYVQLNVAASADLVGTVSFKICVEWVYVTEVK